MDGKQLYESGKMLLEQAERIGNPEDFRQAAKMLKEAAEAGYPEAQFLLGNCYADGIGVSRNLIKAAAFWGKAVRQDYAPAMEKFKADIPLIRTLANAYQHGLEIGEDLPEACYWWEQGVQQGDAESCYQFGKLLYLGQGISQDTERAVLLLEKAVDASYEPAEAELAKPEIPYHLALAYLSGRQVGLDAAKGLAYLQRAIVLGSVDALYEMGCRQLDGRNVARDELGGALKIERAAQRGHAEAVSLMERASILCALGKAYQSGYQDTEKDLQKAAGYFEKASSSNDQEAMFYWAECLYGGLGVAENKEKAARFFEMSADFGFEPAKIKLQQDSRIWRILGDSCAKYEEWEKAYRCWLQCAVDDMDAKRKLAELLWEGRGCPVNRHRAIRIWEEHSQEQDWANKKIQESEVLYELGMLYIWGDETEYCQRDHAKAVGYLKRSSEMQYPPAIYRLGSLLFDDGNRL